jgi:Tol biopolymer transport system component
MFFAYFPFEQAVLMKKIFLASLIFMILFAALFNDFSMVLGKSTINSLGINNEDTNPYLLSVNDPSSEHAKAEEWIAYIGTDCSIWIIRPDGSGDQILIDNQDERSAHCPIDTPKWSYDGLYLAYLKYQTQLLVYSIENDETILVYDQDNCSIMDYVWKPDRNELTYFINEFGCMVWDSETGDVSNPHEPGIFDYQLSTGSTAKLADYSTATNAGTLEWSFDSRYLIADRGHAFLLVTNVTSVYDAVTRGMSSHQENLGSFRYYFINNCKWSPLENSMACVNTTVDIRNSTPTSPGVVLSTPNFSIIKRYEYQDNACTNMRMEGWSPDGKTILTRAICENNQDRLLALNLATGEWTFLLDLPSSFFLVSGWSPDSENILIYENSKISSLDFNSQIAQELTETCWLCRASWQPVGTPFLQPDESDSIFLENVDRKRDLIKDLEYVDIPASIFTLPNILAYNETSAKLLLNHYAERFTEGNLTLSDKDAFHRLVLQEETLAMMLPSYTAIMAYQSDIVVDLLKVLMSFNRTANILQDTCEGKTALLCYTVMKEVNQILNDLTSKIIYHGCASLFSNSSDKEYASNVCQLTAALIIAELDDGKTLTDLIISEAIQIGLTTAFIRPYLNRSQKWLDKGVQTADYKDQTEDQFQITGSIGQAEFKTYDLSGKAEMHRSIAEERYTSFKRGTDVTSIATDLADLALLTPAAAIGKFIGLVTRFTETALDTYVLLKNADAVACVEFLSKQANEIAYDADVDQIYCEISYLDFNGHVVPASMDLSHVNNSNPLIIQMQDAQVNYRLALNAVIKSFDEGKLIEIHQSIQSFIEAKYLVDSYLDQMTAILTSKNEIDQNQSQLFDAIFYFQLSNLRVFLAVAEYSFSGEEHSSSVNIQGIADGSLVILDYIVAKAKTMSFEVPETQSVILIERAAGINEHDDKIKISVEVRNIGNQEINDLRFIAHDNNNHSADVYIGKLDAGNKIETELVLYSPEPYIFINVLDEGGFLASKLVQVEAAQIITQTSNRQTSNRWWERDGFEAGFIVSITSVMALILVLLFWRRNMRKGE